MMLRKTFIIAEAGVNHNSSVSMAKELIDTAVEADADAIKFQSFHTENLVCYRSLKAKYQEKSIPQAQSQYEMLKKLELSQDDQIDLLNYCRYKEIKFLSTPFDLQSFDFLNTTLDLPLIKIASGEITNAPLILKISQSGKPIILSTGMSTLGEIETALSIIAYGYLHQEDKSFPSLQACLDAYYSIQGHEILQKKVSLLHCTTEYPAPFEEINLRVMNTLRDAFGLSIGYSDHTSGIAIPIAAVACGAQIIEKHFTLDKTLPGPDHQASLEPQELALMIKSIREVELALGSSIKIPTASEIKNRLIARKSLVAKQKINQGEPFTEHNIACKRPGDGISPIYFWNIKEKRAERHYEKDELIDI